MSDFVFNGAQYLERINCGSEPAATIEFLQEIQLAQLYTIPFENFDICLNRGIDLEPAAIFKKLVRQRRGGYCFELNGLFLMALQSFGFDVRALLGRVHVTGVPTGRGHQVSLVTIDDRQWIVDVGFGAQTPRMPIPLICGQPIAWEDQKYRLTENEQYGYMLQSEQKGEWSNLYSVDLSHVCPGDITYGNHFTSTHPSSIFVSARVATLQTSDGEITLRNHTLKTKRGGLIEEKQLAGGPSYINELRNTFGIDIEADYEELNPIVNE